MLRPHRTDRPARGCSKSIAQRTSSRSPYHCASPVRAWSVSPCAAFCARIAPAGSAGTQRGARYVGHDATIRTAEAKLTIGLPIDLIALLVDGAVMAAAQQYEVRERRRAALGPVSDVVGLAEASVTAREAAAAVPMGNARLKAGGIVRVLAPTSTIRPSASWRITTRLASHARRWDVSAETRAPSSTTDWPG